MKSSTLISFPIWSGMRGQIGVYITRTIPIRHITRRLEGPQTRQSHSLGQGITFDQRARLSNIWAPSGGIAATAAEDSHSQLIRAGFLRQAHSGIYHMLPLGLRVQDKLEALIDKYMSQLGASKLDLSSISSEELWERSGRLKSVGSELFRFRDRKDAGYLLSPTHEEEITTLVSNAVKSYKQLPVRVYQTSRKYRDELRPRQGLLRTREFIMKDLYTFDCSSSLALATYNEVRAAYSRLFDELKIPYLVAAADSGDIGGNLSHEFHFPTSKGEDHVISCSNCDYVANEELAESPPLEPKDEVAGTLEVAADDDLKFWYGISRDKTTLIRVWYMSSSSEEPDSLPEEGGGTQVNIRAVKGLFSQLDTSIEHPVVLWLEAATFSSSENLQILNIKDSRVPESMKAPGMFDREAEGSIKQSTLTQHPETGRPLNMLQIKNGDLCPSCSDGRLKVQKAIELGHTFHLGTRYSNPLEASVTIPKEILKGQEKDFEILEETKSSGPNQQVAMQMGCHGIGVSRMIGAVADTLADEKGLNWPRVMAPYEVIVVPGRGLDEAALEVYDGLSLSHRNSVESPMDLVLDDRTESFPWKMQDADLVGYPVIVVVGRKWKTERMCEVQCRRLKIREDVAFEKLAGFVDSLLEKL